jgi:glycogen operon protein
MTSDRLLPLPHQTHLAPGAHWDGRGTLFAVFAEDAERVELCLFDAGGRHETARLPMPECTDGIWHGYLPNARPGQLYGYRVAGPYEPKHGHRFNPHKLLVDPYARRLAGAVHWHDSLFGYRIDSPRHDLSFDRRDSAAHVPKAVIVDDRFEWGDDRAPRVPWTDTVIYETHVKGFSQRRTDLPEHDRGTFGALGHRSSVDYLRSLGVTAVELLPIHAFVPERALIERGLTNYWGYNTLAFFAPHAAYLSDGTLGQVKWAVQQLHAAGIEVFLDVVYNHTCEGAELGPTLSFRGFGNANYYRLDPADLRRYVNDTGCGNTLNLRHPRVIQLVMDSLRYWVSEFHVDGFRFDEAPALAREANGFDPGAGLFDALLQDPVLSRVKLIAEPWDAGPEGYQLGRHPPGFAEWNGAFRDEVRRLWKGEAAMLGALAARVQGSADLFDHRGRRPWASINYVTSHDGFTLRDWASYGERHNEANGEDNRDGPPKNFSHNWGAEGPTGDAAISDTRVRVVRATLATLLCAHGTPMLLGGDEFGRTQQGNNNAYCHDSELSWLDWELAESEAGRAQRSFVAHLLQLRRELVTLRGGYFHHAREEPLPGVRDIDWFNPGGAPMGVEDWQDAERRTLAVRRAARVDAARVEISLLLLNAGAEPQRFILPPPALAWRLRVDTAQSDAPAHDRAANEVDVAGHSVQLLTAMVEHSTFRTPHSALP